MNVRHLAVAVLLIGTTGCGYSIKATRTANPTVNFSNYDTFFLMKGKSSGSAMVDDRLMSSVREALIARGWLEGPEGDGAVAVVVNTATASSHTDQSFYDGWGGWRWRLAGSSNRGASAGNYKAGTVVVTMFDADTKQAIWRGSAPDAMPDGRRAKEIEDKSVARIFDSPRRKASRKRRCSWNV